ncbi:tRNA (guanosine(37)-N1)-methyltransferase TrmD [Candidatus Peregrinibacteria bacterium RIFCSPLOWO2_01_FULL_39_12]|nr:MAG: tRNA (guanosine(37)-N1)-methyltransferase TrmD [Candidatus Peregrinibacteria bacterium RIFCSPLOWO2_01_FULL_39_12]OGJ43425.1 MAG: tRNA (guanosine(37)-N1)-methyltransferase TrmD [Candidatus Peregrinibacteria bacterium RIFCSPLOWO2_02_FULL_39_10]
MRFDILTIFPSSFDSYFSESIIKRAQKNKLIKICTHDIRKFSKDKHKKVDDIPFGGGAGMVMTPQPLYDAIKHVKKLNKGAVIFLSPSGEIFTQIKAERLAKKYEKTKNKGLILICGRYEGIDRRIIEKFADEEISIGKYVVTGGELPAMILVDAISRLLPGVIGKESSHINDSFSKALKRKKEYPVYTRPEVFKGMKVPKVLLSGNHKEIGKWKIQHLHN